MLRLISVIGIALAMVIGFIAISTQMKDDYSVRSRVVDVLKQMKNLAADELQCDSKPSEPINSLDDTSAVEMSPEPKVTPLIGDEMQESDEAQLSETAGNDDSGQSLTNSEEKTEEQTVKSGPLENTEIERNADIVKTMGYQVLDSGAVEVIVIFNDVKGESGKTHIKAGSRITVNCSCVSQAMTCKTVESNINKNYLPKALTKQ